jgi:lipopolysaccharide export system permease protein
MFGARTIRRYIASRFMLTIFGTFLLCSVLIFMIDFVELLRQAGKYGSVPMTKLIWMTLLRLPAYTEILMAFAVQVGTVAALLMLSRKSELAVMRAAGLSVWQFLRPGLTVGLLLGVFAVLVFNPVAAKSRSEAERIYAEAFGQEANFMKNQSVGNWLRQDGPDGSSVLTAGAVTNKGLTTTGVTVFQFDRLNHFIERIDGTTARLKDGYWQVDNAWITRVGRAPERFDRYDVSTNLTPERVQQALGTAISVSVFDLPGLIEAAESAGLTAIPYRIQYQLLLSRPLLLVVMVLLGATVSLRSFRSGKIQTMVVSGMVGGFGFFLISEVSRQIGVSGIVAPWVAIWTPVMLGLCLSLAVLLHQEDG